MNKGKKLYDESNQISKRLVSFYEADDDIAQEDSLKDSPSKKIYNYFLSDNNLHKHIVNYRSFSSKEGYLRFISNVEKATDQSKKKRRINYWMYSSAATIAIIIAISITLLNKNQQPQPTIEPGVKKATLVLADGKTISASEENFTIEEDELKINYSQGSFTYTNNVSNTGSLVINKLIVPMGAESKITLSDGTQVWLNADSRLEYPVNFIGESREVTVSGEVYFEVERDVDHPFIVHMPQGDVRVLGTGFGITSYPEEKAYVTLDHGKIAYSGENKPNIILDPGYQVVISDSDIEKRKVNTEEYIGWKDGKYVFNNRNLGDIMHTMERWYDVQIKFENPELQQLKFNGYIERYESINILLDALKLTNEVNYTIEGQVIQLYK